MNNRKILLTVDLEEGGVAKVYQLKGRDVRELIRMSKDLTSADLLEMAALKSTLIDDKALTMDILDDLSAVDYFAILKAQDANFIVMSPAAT